MSILQGPNGTIKTQRNGPLAQAIGHLSGRVDRLEQIGPSPQSGEGLTGEAKEFVEAVKRGTEHLHELEARVKELEAQKPREIIVRKPKGEPVKIDGAVHPVFEQVLQLAHARKHIFLPGP